MWKRIHSNRDPRDTLYSEIKKEFGSYMAVGSGAFRRAASAYPKLLFGLMLSLLLVSAVLSFTVFRHPEKQTRQTVKTVNPVSDGFGQILQTAAKIRTTIRLKKLVDSISAKKQLSAADSAILESALDSLQKINTKNQSHEN
jgi:hypothetical protein